MAGLQFSQFNKSDMENSARAIDLVLGDYNPNSNIYSNEVPTKANPSDKVNGNNPIPFSSTNVVPYTSKLEQKNQEIPSSFDEYIGPPFKPISVREIYDNIQTPNTKKRLTQDQIQAIIQSPNKQLLPQLDRLKVLTDKANQKQTEKSIKERFYNLSLRQIVENLIDTVSNVMDDIITFKWSGKPGGFEGIMQIFTKDDRLIYLGIIIMIFSILVIMIRDTDTS